MTSNIVKGTSTFRPSARLLKILGSELISDEIVAVTELVKNAHDADASLVHLTFNAVTGTDGVITIRDDGHGMDLNALLHSWMTPAGSPKRRKNERRSPNGRRVLGEKGVGRFAVDKLGRYLELISRAEGGDTEIVARFDWDAYDVDDLSLSDIETHYEVRPASTLTKPGTLLRISGLRVRWNERRFRRLCSRLARLRSPFGELERFCIYIEADDFPNQAGEIRSVFLDRAPYRLEASFDGVDTATISLDGKPAEEYYWSGEPLTCGPVKIRLFAFDLESDALARLGAKLEARSWLKENSGISIYREGFRLWPYGEPHDDWLRLDQRRVNNPVMRLSNNQVVGFVEIGADTNPELKDQTNREGLIHNTAFEHLRELMHRVLNVLEQARMEKRHPVTRQDRLQKQKSGGTFSDRIAELATEAEKSNASLAGRLRTLASELAIQQERDSRTVAGYANLAASGHVAASQADQLRLRLRDMLSALRGSSTPRRPSGTQVAVTEDVEQALDHVVRMVNELFPSAVGSRDRVIDLRREIPRAAERLESLVRERAQASLEVLVPASGHMRTEFSADAFQNVLQILVDNALDWLPDSPDSIILVEADRTEEHWIVRCSDNGVGIPESQHEQIFQPGFTTKERGKGMGLSLARALVDAAGGRISVIAPLDGYSTTFEILFPKKRTSGVTS